MSTTNLLGPLATFMTLVTAITLGCAGCSSSSGESSTDSGAHDGGTSGGDPCSADCDRQADAKCSKTPAGYADACKSLCTASKKAIKAECGGQFDAIYECARNKITYSCSDAGLLQVTPSGACGTEAAACASCNGGKMCNILL